MLRMRIVAVALLTVFSLSHAHSAEPSAPQAEIRLEMPGRTQSVTLKELRAKLKVATFTVDDPVYKKKKTYEGFWLADVLRIAGLDDVAGDEIVFHSADGYAPTLQIAKLRLKKGLLAFREKGVQGGWEKIRQGKAWLSPGPYYLVWDTQDKEYPWPYQLVGIEVVRFKLKYDRIFPASEERGSDVYRGFEIFRTSCLSCHSLNLQGGVVGPELNYPKNITEYWDEDVLIPFIKNPGDFRARSKMPAFPKLQDKEMEHLISYLKWIKDRKKIP